jgi:hypothetical protein
MTGRRHAALEFHGERRTLDAVLPDGWDPRGERPVLELDAPSAEAARLVPVRLRAGRGRGLRISLPPSTPPGRYTGRIMAGAEDRPVVVEVPADARLRIAPVESEVAVDPGGEASLTLTASNIGNVEQELPEQPPLRFFRRVEEPPTAYDVKIPGVDRFVALTARLEPAEGPVAAVEITEGAGTLSPGESRELTVAVRAQEALAAGDRYVGAWPVPGDTVAIGLTVAGGSVEEDVT